MAYSHVGHDVTVGNRIVLGNSSGFAGHCQIGDDVIIGGLTGIHQWVRIGKGAIIGGMTPVASDVIPYGLVAGPRGELEGLNLVGLKRRGLERASINALRHAYQTLSEGEGSFLDRARKLAENPESPEVAEVAAFILGVSQRNFLTPK
jgi:UDP-N-acetylglucosamine acyltransferase